MRAGGRAGSIITVAMLVTSVLVLTAAPASALGLSVSRREGPPGTTVTITASAGVEPCEVFFDAIRILGHDRCPPGQTVGTSFTIPAGATAGAHAFRGVEGTSQVSVGFTVTSTSAPRPPAPPPAPRPPAPAPRPPAPAPPPPAPVPPPPAPTPSPTASPSPAATPTPTDPVAPAPSPTAAAGTGCLQPSSVESLTVTPDSGGEGTTTTVAIVWSPTTSVDCAGDQSEIRVNGETASDPLVATATEARIQVDIPEDVSGDIPVSLVTTGPSVRVLATTQFTVEGGDGEGVSSWLLVAAGAVATLAAVAIQRLYSRRRARYGRR